MSSPDNNTPRPSSALDKLLARIDEFKSSPGNKMNPQRASEQPGPSGEQAAAQQAAKQEENEQLEVLTDDESSSGEYESSFEEEEAVPLPQPLSPEEIEAQRKLKEAQSAKTTQQWKSRSRLERRLSQPKPRKAGRLGEIDLTKKKAPTPPPKTTVYTPPTNKQKKGSSSQQRTTPVPVAEQPARLTPSLSLSYTPQFDSRAPPPTKVVTPPSKPQEIPLQSKPGSYAGFSQKKDQNIQKKDDDNIKKP